jgi:hypothetical protein
MLVMVEAKRHHDMYVGNERGATFQILRIGTGKAPRKC